MVAVAIGSISLAPHILFRWNLGEEYKGIYMMQTANEIEYLGRMEELQEGHIVLGSVPYFEYKNSPAILPPNLFDFLFVGISILFGVSLASVVVGSKFFLPPLLFLLVYFFIHHLTSGKESWTNKVNAIAGALFVLFGYDLIDYRTIFLYAKGIIAPTSFLLWTRPTNPISGALFLYAFLLVVWRLNNSSKKKTLWIFCGATLFALMIMSYFFSWGIALSILGALIVINIFRGRYQFARELLYIICLGAIISLPYWYNVWIASLSPWYADAALRNGILFGHDLMLNKFLIVGLAIFIITSQALKVQHEEWWWFCLTFFGAGFLALNQQVITGQTIWPFHFVQYTIPLAVTALFVTFYNGFFGKRLYIWMIIATAIMAVSFSFGVYTQISAYHDGYSRYKPLQIYGEAFQWLNQNASTPCVVLSPDYFFTQGLFAFTRCDDYISGFNVFIVPFDRIYHNYMVHLRLAGVSADNIENYLNENPNELLGALYSIGGLYRGQSFPPYQDIKKRLPDDYKKFMQQDFRRLLEKYRIDYVALDGAASEKLKKELPNITLINHFDTIYLYRYVKSK